MSDEDFLKHIQDELSEITKQIEKKFPEDEFSEYIPLYGMVQESVQNAIDLIEILNKGEEE